ncbi:monocarboxylate transporter 7-like [Diadema antillarum]|uniref:monocarboxylate transporter 7-like n=1 Tax=Diadema antillarum TaxID=105358 RepID=UPI003A8A4712
MVCLASLRTVVHAKWRWVVVIASSTLCGVVYGCLYSFGLLMVALIDDFSSGVSKTGYIGTSSYGVSLAACLLTSPLTTKLGYRLAGCLGVTFCVVASITTSFAPGISVMFFSYSCLYGVGCSFILCCAFNCPIGYFPNKHRSFALGTVSAGVNIGVLIFNPVVYALINRFGWRGMMRITSGIIAMVGCFCIPTFTSAPSEPRRRSPPEADGHEDGRVLKDKESEREQFLEDSGCDHVVPIRTKPNVQSGTVSDHCVSRDKLDSRKARTFIENDTTAEKSLPKLHQNWSSKDSPEYRLQGNGSVHEDVDKTRHFDRTPEGLHEAREPSSADSLKGKAHGQTGSSCSWLHGLEILKMPELWLIQLGFVTAAVAVSFAYFSTVNMTISSGFSKKTAALVMATMGATEVVGKIVLGVITDRLPIPKIFIAMVANCTGALFMFLMTQITPSKPYIFFQATVQGLFVLASLDSLPHSISEQIFRHEYRLQMWAGMSISFGLGGTLGAVFGESVDKTGSYQMAYYGNVGIFLASTTLFGLAIVYQRLFARDRFILFQRVGRRYSAIDQKTIEKSSKPDRTDGLHDDVSWRKSGNESGEWNYLVTERITSV